MRNKYYPARQYQQWTAAENMTPDTSYMILFLAEFVIKTTFLSIAV